MSKLRIAIGTIGFLSALFITPWVCFVCMILLSLRYRAIEVIVLGLLIDLLWIPGTPFIDAFPFFTIAAIVLVWGLEPLRLEFLR